MPEISKIFCFDIAHTFCSFLNSFIGKSWTYFPFSDSTVPVVFGFDKRFVNSFTCLLWTSARGLHFHLSCLLPSCPTIPQPSHRWGGCTGYKRSSDGERSPNFAKIMVFSRIGKFSGIRVIYFLLISSTGLAACWRVHAVPASDVPGVPRDHFGCLQEAPPEWEEWEIVILGGF